MQGKIYYSINRPILNSIQAHAYGM